MDFPEPGEPLIPRRIDLPRGGQYRLHQGLGTSLVVSPRRLEERNCLGHRPGLTSQHTRDELLVGGFQQVLAGQVVFHRTVCCATRLLPVPARQGCEAFFRIMKAPLSGNQCLVADGPGNLCAARKRYRRCRKNAPNATSWSWSHSDGSVCSSYAWTRALDGRQHLLAQVGMGVPGPKIPATPAFLRNS